MDLFEKLVIKLLIVYTIGTFGGSLASNSEGYIKCVSLNNQPCQARSRLVNINSNELLYYPFTVSVNKYCGSSNTIADLYARVGVPNKVKIMNVKVLNLMSGVNEIRFLAQHQL